MLPVIQSLWVGRPLSQLEKLCIRSFVYHGHAFHLYTYDDIEGVPSEAVVKDANEVLPKSDLFYLKKGGLIGPFSDWFRYALLAKHGNCWVDMDAICLKPLDFKEEIFFDGVTPLNFPKGHECMIALEKSCRYYGKEMPWDDARDKNRKRKIRLFRKNRSTAPYMLFGSAPILHKAAKYFGLEQYSKQLTYGTLKPDQTWALFDGTYDPSLVDGLRLSNGNHTLHFCLSILSDVPDFDLNANFEAHSIFERLKKEYGVVPALNAPKIDGAAVRKIFGSWKASKRRDRRKERTIVAIALCIASFLLGYML